MRTRQAVARLATPDEEPTPTLRRKRNRDVTVAVVSVWNPATVARLLVAQDLGKTMQCAFRNGRLQVWTVEP